MNVENEIYNVVDENDQILGTASRKQIHKNNLLHRSIHVLVFNSKNELFLQKRAPSKDENPGLWDTSSAGHVDAGESYDECAHRELWEELGLKANLKTSIKISACQETYNEHVQVYSCITDAEININQEEISEGAFFSLSQVQKEVACNPAQFTSSFKMLLSLIKDIKNISSTGIELENTV
ncbi:MAG: NUDIX domain-containing protein [Nitrospina sp.]|jgi:isopentenyl-diphosphate delta-isomerase type 1|nr:NUDIX domain-containing protein [Nitrospina sp.]MBT3875862.1 NUDIX domain-containing protein [Nitrospina sp.]MBT4049309.1 NUDIX domain-containing protein [Nitrospina sp.]MBT4557277.1 NUDIX domain-containing protein [Nitrospina sp.]MBT5347549.1 NUDIX domain-containing protein [Nitrospina sp.]